MIPKRLITFIIQALVVIVGVFIFSFFDPFNLFNSKKLKSRETPTIVTEIKAMGKLITAEYYGEVIRSSGDSIYEQKDQARKQDEIRLKQTYDKLVSQLVNLKKYSDDNKEKTNNRWQIYGLFKEKYPSTIDNADYSTLIDIINKNTGDPERLIIKNLFDSNNGQIELSKAVKNPKPTIDDLIKNYLDEQYNADRQERKWISNHEIILLGRGSVKAGIDFNNFDTKHMEYFESRNLIRLYHHQPEIISTTINPWFIPEKQIKGFEYIYIGKKVLDGDKIVSVEAAARLKKECRDILENDARHAGIIEHARENAEAVLTNFFSLILDKQVTVEIYGSPLEPYLNGLLSRKKINGGDLVLIDSVTGRFLKTDTLGTYNFMTELYDSLTKKKTLIEPWHNANRNLRLSAFYYLISDDGFLSKKEQDSLNVVTADTAVSLKDVMYYSLTDSLSRKKLRSVDFRISKLDSVTIDSVFKSKADNIGHLKTKAGLLRKEPDLVKKPK